MIILGFSCCICLFLALALGTEDIAAFIYPDLMVCLSETNFYFCSSVIWIECPLESLEVGTSRSYICQNCREQYCLQCIIKVFMHCLSDELWIVDISTILKDINTIDMVILWKYRYRYWLCNSQKYCGINIDTAIMKNKDIDIDLDKEILENVDIDKGIIKISIT